MELVGAEAQSYKARNSPVRSGAASRDGERCLDPADFAREGEGGRLAGARAAEGPECMSGSPSPTLACVLETSLYVDDVARARAFYEEVMGLTPMVQDARLVAYPAGPASVLLLFARGSTSTEVTLPGGRIPGHDGAGRLHIAFAIAAEDLEPWIDRLDAHGVPIESQVAWPKGGVSLYLRDPDRHLLELATPGLWANY